MEMRAGHKPSRRFLFCIAGGYGHFHPLVPLARALKEVGHEVAFAVGRSLRGMVEAPGFGVFQVGGNLAPDPEYQEFQAERETMRTGLQSEMVIYARIWCGIGPRLRTPQLVEIAEKWHPDMLIREAGEYAAAIAAEHLGLPHAAISFAASLKGLAVFERGAAQALDPIRESWGLEPDPALASLYRYLFLSYSPPRFAAHDLGKLWAEGPVPPSPATTRFVRPQFFDQAHAESLPAWVAELLETGRPTIYATMGTEVNREPGMYPYVLQAIVEGLRDLPVNLVVTAGRDRDPADFGPQPPNVHVERYIAQSLLLPRCDLAVTHGGSNTLLQAVDLGLPTVVIPLIADQFFNAAITESLQLGEVVRTWQPEQPGQVDLALLTPVRIGAAAEEVLDNPRYRKNVAELQAEMRALPGEEYAVELVEKVAAGMPLES